MTTKTVPFCPFYSIPGATLVNMAFRYQIAKLVKESTPEQGGMRLCVVGARELEELGYYGPQYKILVFDSSAYVPLSKYDIDGKELWDWFSTAPLKPGFYIFNMVVMNNSGSGEDSKRIQESRLVALLKRINQPNTTRVTIFVTVYYDDREEFSLPAASSADFSSYLGSMSSTVTWERNGPNNGLYLTFGNYTPVYAFKHSELVNLGSGDQTISRKYAVSTLSPFHLYSAIGKERAIPMYNEAPEVFTALRTIRLLTVSV